MTVLAEHRGQGIATALVDDVLGRLAGTGVNSVLGAVILDLDTGAPMALCRRYGLTRRSEDRCSRALVADVDDDLLARWIDAAAIGAADYRVETWEGQCPDRLLEPWCRAAAAIVDAPTGDLDHGVYVRQPDAQRAADERAAARGLRIYRTLALTSDGEPAGMTELFVQQKAPEVAHQGNTGVLAPHRGHGIGRWLKAVNHCQAVAAQPRMRVIETFNAHDNPWMLDINVAMGFRPHHHFAMYQGSLEDALAAVRAR